MKQVIKCSGCETIIRKAGSFNAEISEIGVVTDQFGMSERKLMKTKVSLCRECARKAGYKVKGTSKTFTKDDMAKAYFKGVHDDEVEEESMAELGI